MINTFSGAKSVLVTWYQRICLTLQLCIVSPEIINSTLQGKNIPYGYFQTHYYLIYLADLDVLFGSFLFLQNAKNSA